MTYADLFRALIHKNLITTKSPPIVLNDTSPLYKPNQLFVYHQGAPGHNIEICFPLKSEVPHLIKTGILPFKDVNPTVQANPLPNHGAASPNMMHGCPRMFQVFTVEHIREYCTPKFSLLFYSRHSSRVLKYSRVDQSNLLLSKGSTTVVLSS